MMSELGSQNYEIRIKKEEFRKKIYYPVGNRQSAIGKREIAINNKIIQQLNQSAISDQQTAINHITIKQYNYLAINHSTLTNHKPSLK
jgi:hypothetical protein